MGLSYALGAAFGAWALGQYLWTRQAAMAAGAAGSITLVGIFMATGCFLIGCCGSPMLGLYLGLFGAKALGIGKPLMAVVTLLSVAWGYWYLRRKLATSCRNNTNLAHEPDIELSTKPPTAPPAKAELTPS